MFLGSQALKCDVDIYVHILSVNVDEWLKSANSLSPNDMEAGELSFS